MGAQFSGLLQLRASPPAVPPRFVSRPRLEERFTIAARRPVTLVSAGPGYGKTLSAAYWATHRSETERAAWLSVDESDNNPQAFWPTSRSMTATRPKPSSACSVWRIPGSETRC